MSEYWSFRVAAAFGVLQPRAIYEGEKDENGALQLIINCGLILLIYVHTFDAGKQSCRQQRSPVDRRWSQIQQRSERALPCKAFLLFFLIFSDDAGGGRKAQGLHSRSCCRATMTSAMKELVRSEMG